MGHRLKKVIKSRTKQYIRRDLRQFCIEVLEKREVMTAGPEPVVFIPGFGGTFSADETPTGVNNWLTTRGLPPNSLALEPFGGVYQNIIQSLKNVGYVDSGIGQNLFVVNWDWRVPAAPSDANSAASPNGILGDVTAASISNTVYETGLDYFGKTLADIKVLYPSLTKVDVIGHSTGGIIARSYIQSAAYGQGGLPTIDDLVLAGVPNEGATDPFNLSGNDWSSKAAARAAAQMVDLAYDSYLTGTLIDGPGSSKMGISEVQRVGWQSNAVASGTFTLTFNGNTTTAISASATPATVQAALEALASIGAGNVRVALVPVSAGTQDRVFQITFVGARGGVNQPQATVNVTSITGTTVTPVATTYHEGGNAVLTAQAFDERYVASLANLLPTYDSVDTNNDGVFEKLSATNPAGNTRVNVLMNDLNAGTKNAWLNQVGKTNVVYSTEGSTRDRLVARTGPSPSGFLTDEILSFQNFIGRRPAPGEVWYEDTVSGHGGDGTVSTFSSVDPFLGDSRIGSKLNLIPITGAAAGVASVGHTELVINPFSQTQILKAVGATNFTNTNLVTNLTVSKPSSVAKALSLGLLRPADAFAEAATRFQEVLATTKARDVLDSVVAYTSTKIGTLLPIDSLWQSRVVTPLTNLLTSNPNATLPQLVTALNTALPGAFALVADSGTEKAISFNFSAASFVGGVPTATGTLSLGSGYGSLGVQGNYTLTGNLTLSGILGLDMLQGDDYGSGLFIRDLNLVMGASGSIPNLNANVTLGTLNAAIENGSFNLAANAAVTVKNPTGGNQVTFKQIVDGLPQFTNMVSITPTATLALNLPLNITNTATNFNLATFGTPVIKASSQNLFAGTPDVIVDVELGPALQDQVLTLLASLDSEADNVSSAGALNQEIPGIGRTLNGILNEPGSNTTRRWGDFVKIEKAAENYFGSFDPTSLVYNPATLGTKPTAFGLKNALAAKIDEVTKSLFNGTGGASPISIKGGVDLASNKLTFDLVVNGNFTKAVDLKLNTLGSQWNNIGVNFNANAKVNVATNVDLAMQFGVGLSKASGVDPFFTLNRFNLNSAIAGNGSTLGFTIGNGTIGGTITATKLLVNAGASIAIANTKNDRITIAPSGSLDLDFAFNASLYGSNLVVGASTLPSVKVVDANLFDSTAPTFTLDVAPLLLNLSSDAVVNGLLGLANWLNDATNSNALGTKIPLLNKTIGEVLATQAEPRTFERYNIVSISSPILVDGFKRFSVQLNLGGKSAASVGIKPNDSMRFLATNGERFEATVDSVIGETVTVRYADSRSDSPDITNPSITFQVGGTLGDNLKAALVNYNKPGIVAPSLGQLFNELAEPLGISVSGISYNNVTKLLTLTPMFTPRPIQYTTSLDFGNKIAGLDFNASGEFLVHAAPTIRLPLEINLDSNSGLTPGNRVSIIDDTTPEVSLAVTAQLDNPQARASLGFISAILAEDPAITTNDGIKFNTLLGINVKDPGTAGNANLRATITELTTPANLATSFQPTFTGSFDIDGLLVRPEVAGATIPGQIAIFTTTNGTTRGNATFNNLAELGTLYNNVTVSNSIGSTEALTPEAVATMIVQLGNSIQSVAGKLDVPDGIPFVKQAISGIVNFSKTTQDFARQLYLNPQLIGTNDIAVTTGRLSSDATFAIRIEGGEPSFLTIPASSTTTNNSIDDLYADINAALVAQGFGSKLIAERQLPFSGSNVTAFSDVTASAIPASVQPLPSNHLRFRATFPSSTNLFNLGLRVGDVIEYRDTAGFYQRANVDEMALSSLAFRFNNTQQASPDLAVATRSIALFGTDNANKLAIRTTNPTAGISLELSTVQVTAAGDLPSQISSDLTFSVVIDGKSTPISITAASTANNGQPSDMLASVNKAFADTDFGGAKINQKIRARLEGAQLRIFAIDSITETLTITGATVLGFTSSQEKDVNTARTELGLGDSPVETGNVIGFRDGMLASPRFRANTIQDLVHVLNGMIQQQFAGQPFNASLQYRDPTTSPSSPVRTIAFNIALGTTFTQTVGLDFGTGLDVGFASLNIAGGANATFTANAGVELTVGIDLDPIGSGTVTGTTTLSSLDKGRGARFKVGMFGTSVNSSGKNSPVSDLSLNVAIRQFGSTVTNVSVTVPAAKVSDNTSLSDLANDLTEAIKATNIPGLPVVDDLPAFEVQATSDGKLYLLANASNISGLTINAGTSAFLGFTSNQTSSVPDLAIKLRNGNSFNVDLDFSETLGDVKSKIETAAGGSGVLEVTFVNDQIRLKDKTAVSGSNKFRVSAVGDNNGVSPIGTLLGIVGEAIIADDDPNTPANDAKDGTVIEGTSLLKRFTTEQFYVLAAGSKAFANVTINSSDIDLVASLGILDLGIVDGVMNFTANASINLVDVDDPETTTINESTDGKLRLDDFNISQLQTIIQPSFTYGGSANLPIDGNALVFLPAAFKQGGATPMNIQVTLANQPGSLKPNLTYGVTNLQAALSSFKNFSVADLVGVIQRVVELLQSSDIQGFNTPIPIINQTPNDILNVVGGLAKAAEELLAGPDLDLLNAKILELETLFTKLAGTPSENDRIRAQITGVKSAANPNHAYQLNLAGIATLANITPNDIPLDSPAVDIFDELTRIYGPGVIKSVTGSRSGPYTVTFEASRGNVSEVTAKSSTGLTVQTRTVTEGVANTTSEVQLLTFVSTGQLVAAATSLRNSVAGLQVGTAGRTDLLAKVTEIQDSIASRSSLGKILGDAIKKQLNLPANAFNLTIDFQDADSVAAGFQATAIVKIDIDKSVTKSVGFDFNLPDLGPVTVTTGANLDVTVGGHLDLDFGFRFGTFTPYLLNTTNIALTSSINSNIGVTAGIGGISGSLNGKLQLKGATIQPIANGLTSFTLANAPTDNLVVVSRNGAVQKRGKLITDVGIDYILNTTASPPTIQFKVATVAGTQVEYSSASSPANATVGFAIDPALVPSDANTLGGIPFSQVFSTSIPLANKFDFNLNGLATASLDGNIAGASIDDAITVVMSLNHPTGIDLRFDGVKDYLSTFTDVSKINLSQIITGVKAVLGLVESGLKSDLLEKLPLIGDGLDLSSSFVGKLRTMVNNLETLINGASGSIDALRGQIQQSIFNALGPNGAKILALNPLFHDDPNVANNLEVGDFRDVEVLIPNPLTTPAADLEFGINLNLAGSDKVDVDFDLGVDALAFELETSGGVQINFGYNFNFGFGVNLQKGFFFQLNPNVTYTGGLPTSGTPEIGLSVDVFLKPGTTLAGKLFILNVSATSNPIEDFNRDGILNDGTTAPRLNEALANFDYNRDGDKSDVLTESDVDGNGRLSKGTGLSGNIFIDIANPDNDPKNRLSFAEIKQTPAKTLFNAGITTEAYADLRLKADVSSSSLPNISADLTLDWAIGLTTQAGLIGGGLPDIAIRDVKLDMGSFLSTVIKPVFESLKTYLGPIRPLIDFLASPVPGLNDLSQLLSGPEITFVSLGMIGASANEKTRNAARKAQQVIGLLQEIFKLMDSFDEAVRDGDSIVINFGTFHVTGKPLAQNNVSTTGSGLERVLPTNPRAGTQLRVFSNGTEVASNTYKVVRFKDGSVNRTKIVFNTTPAGTITATYTTTEGGSTDLTDKNTPVQVKTNSLDGAISSDPNSPNSVGNKVGASGKAGAGKTKSMLSKLTGAADANGKGGFGLKIPLITEPSNIFKLFTGEKADIIQWKIPKLDLNVPFSMRFGQIPFPPVPLYATFNAKLNAFADFSVGFDTRGISKTGNFVDGFYFGDLANVTSGADIDEFGISLEASVGAAISLFIATAGIEGGVRADLGFNWNDLDKDGKIYLDELRDLFNLRPTPDNGAPPGSCIFDAHGSITAFIRAYYDVWLFGGDSFTIAELSYSNSIIRALHQGSLKYLRMGLSSFTLARTRAHVALFTVPTSTKSST